METPNTRGLAAPTASPLAYADWEASAGAETLRRMAVAIHYNRWIHRRFARHLGPRVVELGCGIGTMTALFADAQQLTCVDLAPEAIAAVARRFGAHPGFRGVAADLADPALPDLIGRASADAAVCINVLEHVADDATALRNAREVLAPGGALCLFVPAGMYLYGTVDAALGHHRRYTRPGLRAAIEAAGLVVRELSYVNAFGVPGWFLSSRVLGNEHPPMGLVRVFDAVQPVVSWIEDRLPLPFGQSLLCVAVRP